MLGKGGHMAEELPWWFSNYNSTLPMQGVPVQSPVGELRSRMPSVCVLSHFSCVWLFASLWTVAYRAPLSIGFSRREYWSGLPSPTPGDLPDPGIEPTTLPSALASRFFTTRVTGSHILTHVRHTVHGSCKELAMTERLSLSHGPTCFCCFSFGITSKKLLPWSMSKSF